MPDEEHDDLIPFEDYFPLSVYDGYPPEWKEQAIRLDQALRWLDDTRTPFLDILRQQNGSADEQADPAAVDPADE